MATIADILMQQGRDAADARRNRGAAWGNLVQAAGNIPRQAIADQQAQQDRARAIALQGQESTVNDLKIQEGQSALAKNQRDEQHRRWMATVLAEPDVFDPATGGLKMDRATAKAQQIGAAEILPDLQAINDARAAVKVKAALDASTTQKNVAEAGKATAEAYKALHPEAKPITPETAKIDAYLGSLGKPKGTTWDTLSPDEQSGFVAFGAPKPDTAAQMDEHYQGLIAKRQQGQPLSKQDMSDIFAYEKRKTLGPTTTFNLSQQANDPSTPKVQEKLEQQYRQVLQRVTSSRSGGMGLEDQKVNQAIHLLSLFDQNTDPKTGDYTLPKVLQTEAAMGLARLISPTGQPGEQTINQINQRTAKGDIAGLVTYLTGTPVTGNTQAVFKMLRDSIERQGSVAEDNRQKYLDGLRAQAPTDLATERAQRLEEALNLNSVKSRKKAAGAGTGVGLSYDDYLRSKGQK